MTDKKVEFDKTYINDIPTKARNLASCKTMKDFLEFSNEMEDSWDSSCYFDLKWFSSIESIRIFRENLKNK